MMENIKFYLSLTLWIAMGANISFAQTSSANLFYNNGDIVYVQSGAVLHVQGDVVNASGGGSAFTNNGLLNVEGDFTNNGTFKKDVSVGEGTVRLIGNSTNAGSATPGTQTISGTLNSATTASFYNLVIDRGAVGQVVALATDVTVTGSLVWGGYSTSAATYSPSTYSGTLGSTAIMNVRGSSTPPSSGIIQTYTGATDRELYIANGSTTAIAGYKALGWGTAASTEDQSVRTRGVKGVGLGGLAREVWNTGVDYIYPLSTAAHTYNPIKFNFTAVASSTSNKIRGLFCDASSATGKIGKSLSSSSDFSTSPAGSIPTVSTLDNTGYNIYYTNPCVPSHKNWIILDNIPTSGGYWSFTDGGGTANKYVVELYPNSTSFAAAGYNKNTIRAIKYHDPALVGSSDIASDPSGSTVDWGSQIENVVNMPADLFNYTGFTNASHTGTGPSACSSTRTGIPGGIYSGFSHFQASGASASSGNALPVKLIGLSADPIQNTYIRVSWATASEQDNKGFELMRSIDGVTFENIGWTDGNGTTGEQHNYSYNDKTVLANTTYYYKLNQIDIDGRNTETYIVSAEITDGLSVSISEFIPNPTTGGTRLVISTTDAQPVSVKFYDILGKIVMTTDDTQITFGTNTMDFNMNNLADATYTAVIKIGSKSYSKKIVLMK